MNAPQTILTQPSNLDLWRFNEAVSSTIAADSGAGNHPVTFTGGITFGSPGIVALDPSTCISLDGTARGAMASAGLLAFDFNTPFSIGAMVNLNYARNPGTSQGQQAIFTFLNNSGPFNGMEWAGEWNSVTSQANSPQVTMISSTGVPMKSNAAYDLVNGTATHIAFTYDGTGTFGGIQHYVNGREAPCIVNSFGPLTSTWGSSIVPCWGKRPATTGSTSGFFGKIQNGEIYNAKLTKKSVRAVYCASLNINPNSVSDQMTILSAFRVTDDSGNRIRLACADIRYEPILGKYIALSMDTNTPDVSGDQNNTRVLAYSSLDLVNWHYEGVAMDITGSNDGAGHNIWSFQRAHRLYCPATGKWVLWGHASYDSTYASRQFALVAEASDPRGPYNVITQTLNVDGVGLKDMSLFQDDDGTGYVVYTNGSQTGINISRLAPANFHNTDGVNKTTVASTSGREAPVLFKSGGIYFFLSSTSNFYNYTAAFAVKYSTASAVLGTYTDQGSPYPNGDPLGTVYNSQPTCVVAVQGTSNFIYIGDVWLHGFLDFSWSAVIPVGVSRGVISMTPAPMLDLSLSGLLPGVWATPLATWLAPDRIRLDYGASIIAQLASNSSIAGLSVTSRGVSVSIVRRELSSPSTIDVILSLPQFSGSNATITYDSLQLSIADINGNTAPSLTALSISGEAALPLLQTITLNQEASVVNLVGGDQYRLAVWIGPSNPISIAFLSQNAGPISLQGFAMYADAVLTVKSSADNGISDAFTNLTVRDEAGTLSATPSVPFNTRRRFTVENLTEQYLQLSSNVVMQVVLRSRCSLSRISPGTP